MFCCKVCANELELTAALAAALDASPLVPSSELSCEPIWERSDIRNPVNLSNGCAVGL
jgi:hypothetical protein